MQGPSGLSAAARRAAVRAIAADPQTPQEAALAFGWRQQVSAGLADSQWWSECTRDPIRRIALSSDESAELPDFLHSPLRNNLSPKHVGARVMGLMGRDWEGAGVGRPSKAARMQ